MIKTIIMAGGRGTRIKGMHPTCPKPMIKIVGKPILEHQIHCLEQQGITDITLVVGYMKDQITDYFGDGKLYGVDIHYYEEVTPLGTAGALYKLKSELSDDFMLINGDLIFDIDFNRLLEFHKASGALITLAAHPNDHPFDSAILITNRKGQLINWLNKEDVKGDYHNLVNAGIHVISPRVLRIQHFEREKIDLDKDILKPILETEKVCVYRTPEYIKDAGTPERLDEINRDISVGLVAHRNLINKQMAVFLDRDGTINEEYGYITNPMQIVLLEGAAKAIKKINEKGYIVIIITNQPVIARGDCTCKELDSIHARLETLIGFEGAFVNDILFCPHHPDTGFVGECHEYKIVCDCRKPKAGMLFHAANQYNIDLSKSYMVGNHDRDIKAGQRAGCKSVLLAEEEIGDSICAHAVFPSLLDFANEIVPVWEIMDSDENMER